MPGPTPTTAASLRRYGVSVLATGFALLLRLVLGPVLVEQAPLLVFVMAVMVSAWYGGLGPGLFATALCTLAGTYFFVAPTESLLVNGASELMHLGIFVAEGVLISVLNERLRESVGRAEAGAEQLRRLQSVTDTALAHLSLDDLLHELLDRICRILDVDTVAILLRDPTSDVLLVRAARGLEDEVAQEMRVPVGAGFAGRVAAERRLIHLAEVDPADLYSPILRRRGLRSLLGAPLLVEGHVTGVVHVGTLTPRQFGEGDARVLQLVADRAALAIERARLFEAEHHAAQRLEALHEIDRAILAAQSLDELAHTALARMLRLVPFQLGMVVLFHQPTGATQVLAVQTNGAGPANGAAALLDAGAAHAIDQEVQTPYVADLAALRPLHPTLERLLDEGVRSLLALPLRASGHPIGQIDLLATHTSAFDREHRQIAQEVANQLAIALQQAQFREELRCYAAELEAGVVERTNALEEVNAELEAFTYTVSHDLRAPLRAMQGFAAALLEDYADALDPLGQQYAQRVVDAGQQMDTLIQDLLAYSRLSRAELHLQPVDLQSVVAEALGRLEAQIRERGALVSVAPSLPEVLGHPPTLIQVLANLLANAIKFVPEGVTPQVRVWAEPTQACQARPKVCLWVKDNGIGIAPEHQERIFHVFERLHGIETYPGTGIGLAIVGKGVERMGGRTGVESAVGQGSRFWIELPQAEKQE